MATIKSNLILVCVAAVFLQTGSASAEHKFFDKFLNLAHIKKHFTTTLPPTDNSPTTTIFLPTLTNPSLINAPTTTLTELPDSDLTVTSEPNINNIIAIPDIDTDTYTDTDTVAPVLPTGINDTDIDTVTRSFNPLRAYVDDENENDNETDKALENEIIDLEESVLAAGRTTNIPQRKQIKLNKQRVERNRRRQQKVKQNRRRQNVLKKRKQQQRRHWNEQIKRQQEENQRLKRLIKQILNQGINKRPIRIRVRQQGQRGQRGQRGSRVRPVVGN